MITLVRVVETCGACPSQWDAWDAEGNYYYLRYRFGGGEMHCFPSPDWKWSEKVSTVAEFEAGDPFDGDIGLEEFAELAGVALSPDLIRETGGQLYIFKPGGAVDEVIPMDEL